MKTGVLLINLGTPAAPRALEVGKYLREFLMDPFVIDIPLPLRWFLVNVLIVPRRAPLSASQYQKVWTERGSPLLFHTLDLAREVQKSLGDKAIVEPAMRYGTPSIFSAVRALKEKGVGKIVAFPLYPQFSSAATQSSIEKVREITRGIDCVFIPPFYAEPAYLQAVADVSAPFLARQPFDLALFSFHGLPERQIKKTNGERQHCLRSEPCCEAIGPHNADCYRAQCYATAKGIAERLGWTPERYRVCFQSRLGRTPWILPHTDQFYRELPREGAKRIVVLCPSFVADCLETLEEVTLRGQEEFQRNGGESLTLIPSLNASETWVRAVKSLLEPSLP